MPKLLNAEEIRNRLGFQKLADDPADLTPAPTPVAQPSAAPATAPVPTPEAPPRAPGSDLSALTDLLDDIVNKDDLYHYENDSPKPIDIDENGPNRLHNITDQDVDNVFKSDKNQNGVIPGEELDPRREADIEAQLRLHKKKQAPQAGDQPALSDATPIRAPADLQNHNLPRVALAK